MKKTQTGFWETFILIAIVLVIFQTFFEEFAILQGWSVRARHILTFSGLFFDFLFTLEYLIRQIRATVKRQGWHYFLRERGWIDFLASVPLLLLNSLPHTLSIILAVDGEYGALPGFANLMKIVKAVRITRVLRFIRMIKLFGKIQNAESAMAQRHISRIASLLVLGLIAVMMVGALVGVGVDEPAVVAARKSSLSSRVLLFWRHTLYARGSGYLAGEMQADTRARLIPYSLTNDKGEPTAFQKGLDERAVLKVAAVILTDPQFRGRLDRTLLREYLAPEPSCLAVEGPGGIPLYQSNERERFRRLYDRDDFVVFSAAGFRFTISLKDIRAQEAANNLLSLGMILTVVFLLIVFYSKHFAQTVSDVIHVMRRGMSEPDYNLQVRINKEFKDDEIYALAKLYNEEWLALKDRHQPLNKNDTEGRVPDLSLSDFFGDGKT